MTFVIMSHVPSDGVTADTAKIVTGIQPDCYGIKIWAVCDSSTSYAWNMQVYTGRDRNCCPEINQGQRVVLELTEGLENRTVTMDNFFTSYSLAAELKKRRMTLLGTVCKNKTFVKLLDVKSKPANYSEFLFDHLMPATMVTYKPKKNRLVLLLSTKHMTNNISEHHNNKPQMILDYNATKGGVDVLDQMLGTFHSKRKINRRPMAVFCNILDVSAVNAFIIFISLFPQWHAEYKTARRRFFLKELGTALVQPLITSRTHNSRGPNAIALVRKMKEEQQQQKRQRSRLSLSTAESVAKIAKRARCSNCPYSRSANKYSTQCDECNTAICKAHTYTVCHSCVEKQ